jgi:hypothetical protein
MVGSSQPGASNHPETEKLEEDFDELALVGGQTRILVCQWLTSSSKTEQVQLPTPASPSLDLPPSTPMSGSQSSAVADDMNQVHPALMNYISAFSPADINSLVGNSQNPMGAVPIPASNYSEQSASPSDLAWSNYIALPTNDSSFSVDFNPSTFSQAAQSSTNPVVTGAGQFYDEPWRALFHAPEIFQWDLSQPYFMTDESTERY